MQIPIVMIDGQISDRQSRHAGVVGEVSAKWGKKQTITGPALVVPYTYQWTETQASGQRVVRSETRQAIFLPQQLQYQGTVDSEVRTRGIFSVPVYKLLLTAAGEFVQPDLQELGIDPIDVQWDRAYLAVGISDVRAIQEESVVAWNDKTIYFLPGVADFKVVDGGIHFKGTGYPMSVR